MTAVDNLNRATTISGVNRTYDILGNTLTIGSTKSMTWDALNRMLSYTSGSTTTDYQYRADGMRTKKIGASSTDWFYYDGQMPIETAEVGSSSTVVTRNGLGARGIDRIERVGTSTTVGYPIYDGHGNMIATLSKSGSSYSVGDLRSYDAWGAIRSGNTTGDPKGRYCANLGHVDDDESTLTYMRARYYESGSGRFVSNDPKCDGPNWYTFCLNNPINLVDESGTSVSNPYDQFISTLRRLIGMGLTIAGAYVISFATLTVSWRNPEVVVQCARAAAIGVAMVALGMGVIFDHNPIEGLAVWAIGAALTYLQKSNLGVIIETIIAGTAAGDGTHAKMAVAAYGKHALMITGALLAIGLEECMWR